MKDGLSWTSGAKSMTFIKADRRRVLSAEITNKGSSIRIRSAGTPGRLARGAASDSISGPHRGSCRKDPHRGVLVGDFRRENPSAIGLDESHGAPRRVTRGERFEIANLLADA
jgi:hypothetical protein